MKELIKLYVGFIKNIVGSDLINSKKMNTKEERDNIVYSLNKNVLENNLELNSYKNINMKDFIKVIDVKTFIKSFCDDIEFYD